MSMLLRQRQAVRSVNRHVRLPTQVEGGGLGTQAVRSTATSSAACRTHRDATPSQAMPTDQGDSPGAAQPDQSASAAPAQAAVRAEAEAQRAQHWLDRHFPGTREWLENQNRKWWLKGLQARCRQHLELQGREQFLGQLIEDAYQQLLAQHAKRVTDERSQTHLQVACLVLATAKVLRPWIKDDEELMRIIRAHMGDQTSPLLRFLLRYTLYLSFDPYASTVHRLRMLQLDYGHGFQISLEKGPEASSLAISSCFYQSLFADEDLPQLTGCCCCSQDSVWFRQLEKHKVGFQRTQWLGEGDSMCKLQVTRLAKRK